MKPVADAMLARMEASARDLGTLEWLDSPLLRRGHGIPRWRLSERWVEFECGCVAERISPDAIAPYERWEPVIFDEPTPGIIEYLAVYDQCCSHHRPAMDRRISLGGRYSTFDSWYLGRRYALMGGRRGR